MKNTYFYRDKPLFGLDISNGTVQIAQLTHHKDRASVSSYGSILFAAHAVKEGVIVDVEAVASVIRTLMGQNMQGTIAGQRVAMSIPVARTYSRAIKLPKLEAKELDDAVRLEAEQYIPVSIDSLYIDYSIIQQTAEEIELFAVAVPKQIVDSYLSLAALLEFEPVLIETSIDAAARLFVQTPSGKVPTVLVDFGQDSADITIIDKTIIATGTVSGGVDTFTANISTQLGVSKAEAHSLKTQEGLNYSKHQQQISKALSPLLDQLFKEVRRMIRYYDDRYDGKHHINQIVLMGKGATIPGLTDRMTDELRFPVRTSDPWQQFDFANTIAPIPLELRSQYITAVGLASAPPTQVFL